MEYVPAIFVKSVLCISNLSTVEAVWKLPSRFWCQLVADQMARRKNWRLCIGDCVNGQMGYFESDSESPIEQASFEEFARKDPSFNQITAITYTWEDYESAYKEKIASKLTLIADAKAVKSLERRFFPRINYSAFEMLKLNTIDSIGLHSAILNHLVDKNIRIRNLGLSYNGRAATKLLKRMVKKKVIIKMKMYGDWPPKSTEPLIEALVPQRQLRE
uniref:F-box domain-containing protein n=1 Tax=Steinernema glaseri TaxID=37863 RepID=A0A1I7Y7C1_9BILA